MLVLKRYLEQIITIGDDIEIKVTEIRGQCDNCHGNLTHGSVKLGIDAPRSIPVHRKEVQDRIRNTAAPANRQGETA